MEIDYQKVRQHIGKLGILQGNSRYLYHYCGNYVKIEKNRALKLDEENAKMHLRSYPDMQAIHAFTDRPPATPLILAIRKNLILIKVDNVTDLIKQISLETGVTVPESYFKTPVRDVNELSAKLQNYQSRITEIERSTTKAPGKAPETTGMKLQEQFVHKGMTYKLKRHKNNLAIFRADDKDGKFQFFQILEVDDDLSLEMNDKYRFARWAHARDMVNKINASRHRIPGDLDKLYKAQLKGHRFTFSDLMEINEEYNKKFTS